MHTTVYAVIAYSAQKSSLHFLVVCSSRVAREISAPFYRWLLYYNFYGRGRRSLLRYGRNDEELRERTNGAAAAAPSLLPVSFAQLVCFLAAPRLHYMYQQHQHYLSVHKFFPLRPAFHAHITPYTSCGGHWQATEPFSITSHIQYMYTTTHSPFVTLYHVRRRNTVDHMSYCMTLFDGPSIYLLQPTGKENHSDTKHNTVGYFYPLFVSLIYFCQGALVLCSQRRRRITAAVIYSKKNLVVYYQGKL